MIAPEPPTPSPAERTPEPTEPNAAVLEAEAKAEAEEEGSQIFHAALVLGLIPGVSIVLGWLGWARLRETSPRWAKRIVALGALDAGALLAGMLATILAAGQLASGALSPGGVPTGPAAVGPRPRIGVVVEDADGGAHVLSVAPGSPAADAGVREHDLLRTLDGAPLAGRDALTEGIATGPLAPRTLGITRGGDTLELTLTPVAGPFRPVPLDAARCADALPDEAATRAFLTSGSVAVGLGVVALVVGGLFLWGRRRGLPARESATAVLPLVGVLFVAPSLGGLIAALLCPLAVSWNVRFESVEIVVSEIVLTAMALGLWWTKRDLGPALTDEGPRYGYPRTLAQAVLYVFTWMPRALMLSTPVALFFFAEGALDEAPVAELISGAGRTPLDATLTFVAAALLAPIAEEALFRGVLAPHLGRLTDGFTAVLVTAALFGVLHIGGHGPLFVGPMFLGAILGWARLRSGGLAAPITLHMMLNGTAMTLALTLGLE